MSYLKKMTSLLLTIFVFTTSFSQVEQTKHRLDDVYKECYSKHHGDFGALKCANEISQEWDKEILKYYNALMNILDTNAQNNLKQAEDQWMKYRNKEYIFSRKLYDMEGTMYSRIRAQKNMKIVRSRALELKSYYWILTEEDEPKIHNSTKDIELQKYNSVLPTPNSIFFNNPKPLAENIIEKYVKTYFETIQPIKLIARGRNEHEEPIWNCHQIASYGSISVETNFCDSTLSQSIRFENYSFEEVNRILKMLFKNNEYNIWNGNKYGPIEEGAGDCYTEIKKTENSIIINYYCVGC